MINSAMDVHNKIVVDFLILAASPWAVIQVKPANRKNNKAIMPLKPKIVLIIFPVAAGKSFVNGTGLLKLCARQKAGIKNNISKNRGKIFFIVILKQKPIVIKIIVHYKLSNGYSILQHTKVSGLFFLPGQSPCLQFGPLQSDQFLRLHSESERQSQPAPKAVQRAVSPPLHSWYQFLSAPVILGEPANEVITKLIMAQALMMIIMPTIVCPIKVWLFLIFSEAPAEVIHSKPA